MKYLSLMVAAIVACFSVTALVACPTCIGRLERKSPPFFSKEYDERCCSQQDRARQQTEQCACADADDEEDTTTIAFNQLLKEES